MNQKLSHTKIYVGLVSAEELQAWLRYRAKHEFCDQ
jgi:hypothetical protein